ncbi:MULTISPECIES: acetyl-CoA carboxylase biotin carboxylase subunit family protein [unclassified Streptomyces]|uniref:ATP-grasp domain-containing protein n=1 Tax=unclassified Streptomyces TaxID=2593676 RepID=UPI0009389F10|nr:ATP-grasp domain-containing protein [Streptomyces sp. TSRI0281]OKI45966.1 biotin carboxylase [Streptomyces sp. TSRI0281]
MSAQQRHNIFVIGLDPSNLPTLTAVPDADTYDFHPLLTIEELQEGEVSVPELLNSARRVLDAFEGPVDAIVGYWDFPVSTLVPILGKEYGTRTTSLESVVKCEHKYWSRLEQQKVIDEYPRFGRVDLESDDPQPPDEVSFPMWLKPALSYSSELAYSVSDMDEFRAAVKEIRGGISRVGRPFEHVMDLLELPPEMRGVGGQVCLAEESMTGLQAAVEGYVHDGEVTVYGALDSINYPGSSSFLRHQYPSALPDDVISRMYDVSRRTMEQIGMDRATFSIEYFYDPKTGDISLLEINPRHSQSHAELFDYVDGAPNHHRMLSLALGRDPALPAARGPYRLAAKWYYRWFGEGRVHTVPGAEELARIEKEIPGVRIDVVPHEGQRLSSVPQQDSYSYEVAHIFTGGDDEDDLRRKFDRCVAALGLTFDRTAPGGRDQKSA